MTRKAGSLERAEINRHLHRMHDGFAGVGSTLNRHVQHDALHDGNDLGGKPLHRHQAGSLTAQDIQQEEDS